MAHTIRLLSTTVTVSSGSGTSSMATFLPLKNAGGYIEQVIVIAPTSGDTFDFSILDSDSQPVFRRKKQTTEIIEERHLPVRGTYTLQVQSASADGTYTVKIAF